MPVLLSILFIALIIVGPQYWVKSILHKYHQKDEDNFTGTGGEFAEHILETHGIDNVNVEITEQGDHYDPTTRTVRLSKSYFEGKTLTSITIAAHECGHAIQHFNRNSLFRMRTNLAKFSNVASKIGSFLLFSAPFTVLLTRAPSVAIINITGAFLVLGFGIAVHMATLPVELDASFSKAMPILERGYLTKSQLKSARKILRAAAYTYVAASLMSLLNFWRWLAILKR